MSFSSISSNIISACGNPSSIIPLAIKDTVNNIGSITTSNQTGGIIEAKDRAFDEFGTQFIWLFGLPICKKVFDSTIYKIFKQNPKVDIRLLTKAPEDIINFSIKNAPSNTIKKSIENFKNNPKKVKALFGSKFVFATVATALMYKTTANIRNLTTKNNVKHKMEQQKQNAIYTNKHNNEISFQGSFKNALQDFAMDPVKNMMLIDCTITGSRLTESRNKNECMEYALSEGSFWLFMYGLNTPVLNAFQKASDKLGKNPINLDIRILNSSNLSKIIKDGTLEKDIKSFNQASKILVDIDLVKKAIKEGTLEDFIKNNPDNELIKTLKDKSVKKIDENAFKKFVKKHSSFDKIDITKHLNISSNELKKLETNGELKVLDYLIQNPKNSVVQFAKDSDIISNFIESKTLKEKFKHIFKPDKNTNESFLERVKTAFKNTDTGKLDTSQFIDTKALRNLSSDLDDYNIKCKKVGTDDSLIKKFIKKSKTNKVLAVMSTMILGCFFSGYVVPHLRVWLREKMQGSKEFHVANDYQKQLSA